MEEIKQGWKKRISWLLIALTVVIVYKMLDNFSSIQAWFGTLFTILKPFLIGLLIAYILFIPCKKRKLLLNKLQNQLCQTFLRLEKIIGKIQTTLQVLYNI